MLRGGIMALMWSEGSIVGYKSRRVVVGWTWSRTFAKATARSFSADCATGIAPLSRYCAQFARQTFSALHVRANSRVLIFYSKWTEALCFAKLVPNAVLLYLPAVWVKHSEHFSLRLKINRELNKAMHRIQRVTNSSFVFFKGYFAIRLPNL